jgi:hypothetical protein
MPFKNLFCRWLVSLQKIHCNISAMVYLMYTVTIGTTGQFKSIYSQTTYVLPTFPLQSFWMAQGDEGFGWLPKYWSCLKGIHT